MVTFEAFDSERVYTKKYNFTSVGELLGRYKQDPKSLPELIAPLINCFLNGIQIYPSCFSDLLVLLGCKDLAISNTDDFMMEEDDDLSNREKRFIIDVLIIHYDMLSSQKRFLLQMADDIIETRKLEIYRTVTKLGGEEQILEHIHDGSKENK